VPATKDSSKNTGRKYMASDEKIRELIKNRTQDFSSSRLVTSSQVWLQIKDI
jgi:hypothetical protein